MSRLLFASYHCPLDPSSGAALATRDLLVLLAARGWACGAFTGPRLDYDPPVAVGDHLRRLGQAADVRRGDGFALYHTMHRGVPVTVFAPDGRPGSAPSPGQSPTPSQARAFAAALARTVAVFRPAVILTYGGDPPADAVVAVARAARVPVVFAVHNFAYTGGPFFRPYAAVLVPSDYARVHYRDVVGVEATALPPVWDWGRTACDAAGGRFVTFVNPRPEKGVYVFARIAEQLAARRPDLPVLVVQGRGDVDRLGRAGVDLTRVRTVHRLANGMDPRAYLRRTRVLVIPSLWRESFCRTAAEAMQNGIPVVASTRGSLPETVGMGGSVLDIPARYTPRSTGAPSAAEVREWVDRIEALWADDELHAAAGRQVRAAAQRWHPDVVMPAFETFFRGVAM